MLFRLSEVMDDLALEGLDALLKDVRYQDGGNTAGFRARRVKCNEQATDGPVQRQVEERVLDALEAHTTFQRAALPLIIKAPLLSRYHDGMTYGDHVDDAVMGRGDPLRADISVTLFLSAPESYDGGELVLTSPFGETRVKLSRGDAVMYPSNTVHRVEPVTRGKRLAAVTWVQSRVRDPGCREILWDLYQVANAMHGCSPERVETTLAFKTYSNLLRQWAET